MTREKRSSQRTTCSSDTLSTTNLIWTAPGSNCRSAEYYNPRQLGVPPETKGNPRGIYGGQVYLWSFGFTGFPPMPSVFIHPSLGSLKMGQIDATVPRDIIASHTKEKNLRKITDYMWV